MSYLKTGVYIPLHSLGAYWSADTDYLKATKIKILIFVLTFVIGIVGSWLPIIGLLFLTNLGIVNVYRLPYETQEIILEINCGDDAVCRGEKCHS